MRKNCQKPTIKDVAKKSNVSVATVSRILNNLGGYSEGTRKMVMNVVDQIGYKRNAIARNLKIKETRTIGVIFPRMDTLFYIEILNGIQDMAQKNGYSVIICNTGVLGNRTKEYLNVLVERQIDGLIVCSLSPDKGHDKEIVESGLPTVFVSTFSRKYSIPYIKVDDYQAAYAATVYLMKNGHRKIAMLTGAKDDPVAGIPRVRGFRDALNDYNIEINKDLIKYADFSYKDGILAMNELLNQKDDFTAIFAACDDIAIGAMKAAYDKGISIPNDLSIIGYDNTKTAEMSIPGLTSVSQPLYKMGVKAFDMIYEIINSQQNVESIIMPFEIVERDSVKKL